jgi:3-isopropylmalate/(R)-2-methylmalate dehydratase small subunit
MISGRVWCFQHDINTDLLQPSHAMLRPLEEQPKYVFSANRPGWAETVEPGDIIVAGRNFGTGSSRPAARVLALLGIGGLIAESINGLFFRNSVNYAFPALECPGALDAFSERDRADMDLATGVVANRTTGATLQGRAWAPELLKIQRAGGLIEQLREEGLLRE